MRHTTLQFRSFDACRHAHFAKPGKLIAETDSGIIQTAVAPETEQRHNSYRAHRKVDDMLDNFMHTVPSYVVCSRLPIRILVETSTY